MRVTPRFSVLALLLQVASPATAEFFGIPLPELVGPAPPYGGPPIEVSFDFGQEFEHVENVLIMMQATVTALVLGPCTATSSDPATRSDGSPECEKQIYHLGFLLRLDGPPFQSTTAVVEGFREPFPAQPPTSTQPRPEKRAGVFDRTFGDFSFDHLNDGTGTLSLWWNGIAFLADGGTQRGGIRLPTGTIIDAVLIIEATPRSEQAAVVQIDIRPGSDVNVVDPLSRDTLRVALLGSDTFDVREVDVTKLRFGPEGAAPLLPRTHPLDSGSHRDVNRDGWRDLVSRYRTIDTGIALGDTESCLSGETLDGSPFEGCDEIETRSGRSLGRP